jgi:peptide/nickel transport system substrate-binding protein
MAKSPSFWQRSNDCGITRQLGRADSAVCRQQRRLAYPRGRRAGAVSDGSLFTRRGRANRAQFKHEHYEEGASFDPLVCAEQPCIELLHNIFEPLVTTSPDHEIEPCLAAKWERRDETTFRFELRRGVRFHNGERFDAGAVRFSLERASKAYGGTAWFPRLESVVVVDPYTVDVKLFEPDSLFLYRLSNIGLIAAPLEFRRVGAGEFGHHPVGTGAFKFVSWDAESYPRSQRRLLANVLS